MPTSETGLKQRSDVTSHLHTFLVDIFFSTFIKHHEGTVGKVISSPKVGLLFWTVDHS